MRRITLTMFLTESTLIVMSLLLSFITTSFFDAVMEDLGWQAKSYFLEPWALRVETWFDNFATNLELLVLKLDRAMGVTG